MSFLIPQIQDKNIPGERSGHVAVYWNGNIVVWGGFSDEHYEDWNVSVERYHQCDEIWLFNVESCTWRNMITHGEIPPSLSGSCAACVDDVMYLFAGHSNNGPTSNIYILNLKTLTWQDLTSTINGQDPAPSCRDKLCCWQHNELIIFFGGYGTQPYSWKGVQSYGEFVYNTVDHFGDDRGWNNNVFILDTSNMKWKTLNIKGYGPSPRAAHAAAKLGSKAYVFGGRFMDKRLNDVHYIDLDSWQWSGSLTTTGCVPVGRTWHSLTAVSDRHLFLYGGFSNDRQPLADACILDTKYLIWSNISPVHDPHPRMWHTACSTSSAGEVIIFGGCETSLLDDTYPQHSNTVIIFRFSVLSLQRLSADAVLKYHKQLSGKLETLSGSLIRSLISPTRLKALQGLS